VFGITQMSVETSVSDQLFYVVAHDFLSAGTRCEDLVLLYHPFVDPLPLALITPGDVYTTVLFVCYVVSAVPSTVLEVFRAASTLSSGTTRE